MSAHTPGPWIAVSSPGRQHFEVRGPMGQHDAPLFEIMRDPAERSANARLIAAAPDLLAVCVEVLAFTGMAKSARGMEVWDHAKVAIAKATGGQA